MGPLIPDDWDWAAAEAEYKRALEPNPSYSMAHACYADYLSKMGRHEKAIAKARRTVLVAGGEDNSSEPLCSAELYNPVTGTWSATGSMGMARYYHAATLLADGAHCRRE